MKEVYIFDYNQGQIYHFTIDTTDYSNKTDIIEFEIEIRGFNLDEVSYIVTDNELEIEEV